MRRIDKLKNFLHVNVIEKTITTNDDYVILLQLKLLTDWFVRIVSVVLFSSKLEGKVETMLLFFVLEKMGIVTTDFSKYYKSTVSNIASSKDFLA